MSKRPAANTVAGTTGNAKSETTVPAADHSPLGPEAYAAEREEIAYFMRRLYVQKLTTTSGGNISMRLAPNLVAITPAALDKARCTGAQVALETLDGVNRTPELPISSEHQMHLEIYKARPDVVAIVHAHPATATAFTAARQPIDVTLIAETWALVGQPAFAPYALTGTLALAQIVADKAREADCILLENHGIVAVGDTLLRAFDRLELMESSAQMTLVALQLRGVQPLTLERRLELDRLMGRVPRDGSHADKNDADVPATD